MFYIDPTNNGFFQDFAKFIQHEFCKGKESLITNDYSLKDGIWILNYVSFRNEIHKIIQKNGCEYIAIQTEAPHCLENINYMEFLNGATKVFHYFKDLLIGYSDSYRLLQEDAKNIDVLFYGCINTYRSEILNKIPNLKSYNNLFGIELQKEIMRAKIIVSCHYYKDNDWDWDRFPPLICNKNFFITEKFFDEEFNKKWDKYIVLAERSEIPALCEYYLKNPIERLMIVDKAFDFMKSHFKTKFL